MYGSSLLSYNTTKKVTFVSVFKEIFCQVELEFQNGAEGQIGKRALSKGWPRGEKV